MLGVFDGSNLWEEALNCCYYADIGDFIWWFEWIVTEIDSELMKKVIMCIVVILT